MTTHGLDRPVEIYTDPLAGKTRPISVEDWEQRVSSRSVAEVGPQLVKRA